MKTALIAIATNEDHYIQEWIDYYLHLGFDDIYIVQDNGWKANINADNRVHLSDAEDYLVFEDYQNDLYSKFFKQNYKKYDYIAVFDVDEFLVLKTAKRIDEFLNNYSSIPSVCFHWRMFGDNNITEVNSNNYSVINRFTKSASICSSEFKSIYNCRKIESIFGQDILDTTDIIGIHEFKKITLDNIQLDVLKYSVNGINIVNSSYKLKNEDEQLQACQIAYLAHYRKTFPEYIDRLSHNNSVWWKQFEKDHPDLREQFNIINPRWFNEVDNFDTVNMLRN